MKPMQNLNGMTAAILAGGLGRRLRSKVADRPKGLASVGGRPFLAFLLDQLVEAGLRRAVLCTGYLGEQIEAAFGDSHGGLQLMYSRESSPLGTAGALRLALPRLRSDAVLVMNGDSYCDVDLGAFWAWHCEQRAEAAMVVTRMLDTARYGSVHVDADGAVRGFDEKQDKAGPGWINAGIYLLSQGLLETIPAGRAVSLEREMFPTWIGRGLYAYQTQGRFLDIGTPEAYRQAERFFARPAANGGGKRRFVVLDRDGTIIEERHYLSDPGEVKLIPCAAEGLGRLREMGLGLVVITNQSALSRGLLDEEGLGLIHQRLRGLLAAEGIELDGIYFCPHLPEDECSCRKPGTALLDLAAQELDFDPRSCFVIGDKPCDLELGRRVGAATFLVKTGYGAHVAADGPVSADYVVEDLCAAAETIEKVLAGKQKRPPLNSTSGCPGPGSERGGSRLAQRRLTS